MKGSDVILFDLFGCVTCNNIVATKGGRPISEPKKMGWPTDSPKDTMLRVQLDDKSVQELEESAESLETSKLDVMQKGTELVYKGSKK